MRKKKFKRTIKNSKKIGVIKIPPKPPFPEKHELMTASFLSNRGYDIEFISPSQIKGSRTADIIMSNLLWEMKSPISDGKRSLEHTMRDALRQSENIILDLRRLKISTEKAISQIGYVVHKVKKIKRCLLITKSNELLDLKQNFVNIKI